MFGGGDDDNEQQSFSPDLKLFVGNLPFSVDSSVLAELFQEAGNVQMVEVHPFSRNLESWLLVCGWFL